MEVLLEPKFSLLSVTCVIKLLCDLTPIYFYTFIYCHFSTHTTPCNIAAVLTSNVSISRTLQRQLVSCIWDVLLRDPPSLSSFLQTFQISPFFFLLPHLNHLYFLYCPFCFGGVLCIQHAAITPSIVIISCLSSPVRLCAPWGQGLGLSDHWSPIRIRQMTGYQMVNVLE